MEEQEYKFEFAKCEECGGEIVVLALAALNRRYNPKGKLDAYRDLAVCSDCLTPFTRTGPGQGGIWIIPAKAAREYIRRIQEAEAAR
ncbi:MAG: hypothetical protein M3Q29_09420 [Chloroflexota bacterium]|nr:hypothetical protein [Chloroflexota bacterium]